MPFFLQFRSILAIVNVMTAMFFFEDSLLYNFTFSYVYANNAERNSFIASQTLHTHSLRLLDTSGDMLWQHSGKGG